MKKLKSLSASAFLKLVFALFTLAMFVTALCMPDRDQMFSGLQTLMFSPVKVATNVFDLVGYAASFLNAGLIGLLCLVLFCLPGAVASAPSFIAFGLTLGFAFWGVNPLNFWLGIPGVLVYCLVKKVKPGSQVNAMIFTTALSPLYSDLMLRWPSAEAVGFSGCGLAIALAVGLVVGFFLPAGLAFAPKVHQGFSIYSAAVPLGLSAFFLRAFLYQILGAALPGAPATSNAVADACTTNALCGILFALCIVGAFLLGCKPRDYWQLLKHSGHGVDYTKAFGNATALMNIGVYGLFILAYYNIIGASFNAVTLGCIFCMLSCCISGSHPRNVLPIVVGYVVASFAFKALAVGDFAYGLNAQSVVIGLCFANGLAPLSGKMGWHWGILAGVLHFILVTCVPNLHGGFLLYNGGLTAGFVSMALVPVITHFFPKKAV